MVAKNLTVSGPTCRWAATQNVSATLRHMNHRRRTQSASLGLARPVSYTSTLCCFAFCQVNHERTYIRCPPAGNSLVTNLRSLLLFHS